MASNATNGTMNAPMAAPTSTAQPPLRRKSHAVQLKACVVCKKGATEACIGCNDSVCLTCLGVDKLCASCIVIREIRTKPQQAVSKFAIFFKTRKIKPNEYAKTPERSMLGMDAPLSGGKSLFGFLRRGSSSSSRNLTAFLDEEARTWSPGGEGKLPPRSAVRATAAPSDQSSEDTMKRLYTELDKLKALNGQLEKENDKMKTQLERSSSDSNKTTETKDSSAAPSSTTASVSEGELTEAKARVVDLQVQVQEARDEIFRIGAELVAAREREKQLEEYMQNVLAQAQAAGGMSGTKGRSAIPPCVPMPNTAESLAWLESIRNGTYEDYWLSAAATAAPIVPSSLLPPPPMMSSASAEPTVSENGKKRSPIPPAPPLPAGMTPIAPAGGAQSAVFAASAALQGRRGSAPGLLETGPHQKKRESVFASLATNKPDLKPLFWTVLDQNKIQGTIFEKLNDKPLVKPDVMGGQLKTLVTRFAKRAAKGGAAGAASAVGGEAKSAVVAAPVQAPRLVIMDSKRKQQIGIGLSGSFRNVSLLELKKAIINLDTHILTADRVKMLLEMIPTPEEITQLDGFRSGGLLDTAFFAGMSKEETFFTDMAAIPRLKQRLLCVLLEGSFAASLEQLTMDLDTFAQAIQVIRESQKWKEFLALCLETGNYLNEGNNGLGGAWGFSLKEGLKKFSEMKSCENNSRFSLMHWIAEVAATHKPELLGMADEFGVVSDASTKSVEELKSEVLSIKRQLDIVKGEVEKSKMESSDSSTKFLQRMVPFLEGTLSVQYAKLQGRVEQMEKDAVGLVIMHGENPVQTNCQQLFNIILEGVAAFLKCHEDNQAQKMAEQKQMLQAQNSIKGMTDKPAMKRDQSNRIMKDTGMATGTAKLELEAAMAKRRNKPPPQ